MTKKGEKILKKTLKVGKEVTGMPTGELIDACHEAFLNNRKITSRKTALLEEVLDRLLSFTGMDKTPGGLIVHGGGDCNDHCGCGYVMSPYAVEMDATIIDD